MPALSHPQTSALMLPRGFSTCPRSEGGLSASINTALVKTRVCVVRRSQPHFFTPNLLPHVYGVKSKLWSCFPCPCFPQTSAQMLPIESPTRPGPGGGLYASNYTALAKVYLRMAEARLALSQNNTAAAVEHLQVGREIYRTGPVKGEAVRGGVYLKRA